MIKNFIKLVIIGQIVVLVSVGGIFIFHNLVTTDIDISFAELLLSTSLIVFFACLISYILLPVILWIYKL